VRRRSVSLAPILEALPPDLRREVSPERCVCAVCCPEMSETDRELDLIGQGEWRAARRRWCQVNGYTTLDLLRAERPRPPPSKKTDP